MIRGGGLGMYIIVLQVNLLVGFTELGFMSSKGL